MWAKKTQNQRKIVASVQKPVPSPEAHPILQRIRHTRRCDLNRCVATAKANLMQAAGNGLVQKNTGDGVNWAEGGGACGTMTMNYSLI
eukprot:s6815_g4.t1